MSTLLTKSPFWVALSLSTAFFIVLLFTLKDYGPSWDETIHFRRGQAYLHFFLTGKKTYDDLPKYNLQGTNGDPSVIPYPRRSFYQNDIQNGEWFFKRDVGHPPLNGILASIFNYIFYQKLGLLPDIFSYHLFNILVSSLMVFIVTFFAISTFGIFAGLVSFLALATYPLFFSESHFNIKDPMEAAFFSGVIWTIYQFLRYRKPLWLLGTSIFLGLALGTKFNILFAPIILLLYLFYLFIAKGINIKKYSSLNLIFLSLVPVGGILIFLLSWPYVLADFPKNLLIIFTYYKEIGTGINYQSSNFYIFGFNIYPTLWIIFTTPITTLFLSLFGIYVAIKMRKLAMGVSILWLIWFLIPILRVSVPNSAVYGGVRQIMEFIPAMALLAGIGAFGIVKLFKNSLVAKLFILMLFLWPVLVIYKMHPNQNVYFNQLIGGLNGAQVKNFPSWGNSFGNAYFQGINWLNQNAEKGAKVSLIQGTSSNAPSVFFRKDINYLVNNNLDILDTYFSGFKRDGEYLMELTFNDTGKDFYYIWDYVEKFLKPVYEVRIDGVSILKIWKNDLINTKTDAKYYEKDYKGNLETEIDKNALIITLQEPVLLSSLQITSEDFTNCNQLKSASIELSEDKKNWDKEKDYIGQYQLFRKNNLTEDGFKFYLASKKTKYIKVIDIPFNSCILINPKVKITKLVKN